MTDVAIIGAGMAGLAAARTLRSARARCTIFEAKDHVGGAVTSERFDDVTVDRGFQVFNSWYPAVKEILSSGEYSALRIKNFQPGIQTLTPEGPALIVDPVRAPALVPKLVRSKLSSALSLRETLRLQKWLRSEISHRSSLELRSPSKLSSHSDSAVKDSLDAAGVTGKMRKVAIDPILRAFLFDTDGQTSAAFSKWIIMTLLRGTLAVPENGMSDLSETMGRIPGTRIELNSPVERIDTEPAGKSGIRVHVNGEVETFSHAILGVSAAAENRLIGTPVGPHRGQSTWWFVSEPDDAHEAFNTEPVVTVDGGQATCLDAAAEVTSVAPSYAPGRHLIAATKVHDLAGGNFDASRDLPTETDVKASLSQIYDADLSRWDLVTRHDIPDAIPLIAADQALTGNRKAELIHGKIAVAGVHHATPSVDGAIRSGQRAARQIIAELSEY